MALVAHKAAAGAWTQPEGAGITISKIEYSTAATSFDGAGESVSGTFHKLHAETYTEYGLTDAITLIGQIDYDTSWLETTGEPAISEGIGRIGLWTRARVWRNDTDVASAQVGVEFPGGRSGLNAPALGAEPRAVSLKGLYGHSYADDWGNAFLDAQAGVLLRGEDAPAQVELDLTAGRWLADEFLLMGQLFNTFSLNRRADGPQDYDETRGVVSIGWKATEDTTLLLGVSADLATRGLEPQRGAFFSVWKTF